MLVANLGAAVAHPYAHLLISGINVPGVVTSTYIYICIHIVYMFIDIVDIYISIQIQWKSIEIAERSKRLNIADFVPVNFTPHFGARGREKYLPCLVFPAKLLRSDADLIEVFRGFLC